MREIAKRCRTYFKVDYLRYKAWREPKVKLDGVHVEFYEQYVKIWDDQTTMMNQIICYEYNMAGLVCFDRDLTDLYRERRGLMCKICDFLTGKGEPRTLA